MKKETLIYKSSRQLLEVRIEENGEISLFYEDGTPYESSIGQFIYNNGGKENFINKCFMFDGTIAEFLESLQESRKILKDAHEKIMKGIAIADKKEYDELIRSSPIPTTSDNIRIVLRHFRNEGRIIRPLPQFDVPYSINEYRIEETEKTAIAMKFDNGLKFAINAPIGHLLNYYKIR